ncbi:MAG: phenylacetic acid degradation-related protein [Frankiales bacterium]|nr:phenylacetic acid degradation-related protein [Frankiales bacterium]
METWGEARSKTVEWHDPRAAAAVGLTKSGIEHLQAVADGELPPPPIAVLLGFGLSSVRPGEVTFTCTPDESVYNPIGTVHGGLVCALLDSVCGCAVQSTLPQGQGYTSVEIKVSFLRAVHAGDALTAVGRIVKPGRRVAFSEGEVRDAAGKPVATATSTCLVFDLPV